MENRHWHILVVLIQAIIPDKKVLLMQADVHICRLLNIQRVVPSGDGNWMGFLLLPYINGHKFSFDPHLFPVLNLANAGILEYFLKFSEFNFLMSLWMGKESEPVFSFFLLIAEHCVGIILEGNKFIFIKLFVFNIVKSYNISFIEVF